MKGIVAMIAILFVLCGMTVVFALQEESTAQKGRELFINAAFGKSGKTCNDCHPGGKGLEKAGERKGLEGFINNCIRNGLKERAYPTLSREMQSLVLYIRSIGK